MDDGLGSDDGRFRNRVAPLESEAGKDAEARCRLRDAKKSTSTMAKLDRYGTFFRAPAGNVLAGERETFYTRAFKDGWPAEVFFVTPSEARRDSITRVIAERESSDKYKFPARALTLAEALRCRGARAKRRRGATPPRPRVRPRRAARQL
jgi:hypothetical protein